MPSIRACRLGVRCATLELQVSLIEPVTLASGRISVDRPGEQDRRADSDRRSENPGFGWKSLQFDELNLYRPTARPGLASDSIGKDRKCLSTIIAI